MPFVISVAAKRSMKRAIAITYALILMAALATVFFVNALQPTSAGAYFLFAIWLVIPHIAMGVALFFLRRKERYFYSLGAATIIVFAGSILLLANIIYWNPDAQGAIAVLMIPILQGGALAFLLPAILWVSRKVGAPQRIQPHG